MDWLQKPQVPGFALLRPLREGVLGRVWKARRDTTSEQVCLEVVSLDDVRDPYALRELQDRIEQLSRLEHPCLAQIRDGNVYDNQLYLVSEYTGDMTLHDWYSRAGKSRERNALIIGETIAAALRYVWQRGQIIHGAMRPDTILIDEDGGIKLAGVGMGTLLAAREGKDVYTAPEQMGVWRSAQPGVDMYALGAVMCQVATGGRGKPIPGGQPDPRLLNPLLSDGFVELISQLMGTLPEERPINWLDVLLDVRRLQAVKRVRGTPIPATRSETERWAVNRGSASGPRYRRVPRPRCSKKTTGPIAASW